MGEIPEKSIFRQPGFAGALRPYFQLSETVRIGDLAAFHEVLQQHSETFRKDNNLTLIQRFVLLTHSLSLSLSYSSDSRVNDMIDC